MKKRKTGYVLLFISILLIAFGLIYILLNSSSKYKNNEEWIIMYGEDFKTESNVYEKDTSKKWYVNSKGNEKDIRYYFLISKEVSIDIIDLFNTYLSDGKITIKYENIEINNLTNYIEELYKKDKKESTNIMIKKQIRDNMTILNEKSQKKDNYIENLYFFLDNKNNNYTVIEYSIINYQMSEKWIKNTIDGISYKEIDNIYSICDKNKVCTIDFSNDKNISKKISFKINDKNMSERIAPRIDNYSTSIYNTTEEYNQENIQILILYKKNMDVQADIDFDNPNKEVGKVRINDLEFSRYDIGLKKDTNLYISNYYYKINDHLALKLVAKTKTSDTESILKSIKDLKIE